MNFQDRDGVKFERVKDMPKMKADIVSYLFYFICKKPADQWWQYKGEFEYQGIIYDLECECSHDNEAFIYRNMYISYQQKEIYITDAINKGFVQ
jgi:hypothetical protein